MKLSTGNGQVVPISNRTALHNYVAGPLVHIRNNAFNGKRHEEFTTEQLAKLYRELELRAYKAQFVLKKIDGQSSR